MLTLHSSRSRADGQPMRMMLIHPNEKGVSKKSKDAWDAKLNKSPFYKSFGADAHTLHVVSGKEHSSSINSNLFAHDFLDQLIPDIRRGLTSDQWAVHFIDGYGAHLSDMLQWAPRLLKEKILVVVYPPNLTQHVAPPDASSWHGRFKQSARRIDLESHGTSSRHGLLKMYAKAARKIFGPEHSQLAFQEVGLFLDKKERDKFRNKLLAGVASTVKGSQYLYRVMEAAPGLTPVLATGNLVEVPLKAKDGKPPKKHRVANKLLVQHGIAVTGAVNTPRAVSRLVAERGEIEKERARKRKKADERPVRDRSSSSATLPSRSRKAKLSHLSASRTRVGGARRRPRQKAKPKVGKSVHKMALVSLPKSYGHRPLPVRYRDD